MTALVRTLPSLDQECVKLAACKSLADLICTFNEARRRDWSEIERIAHVEYYNHLRESYRPKKIIAGESLRCAQAAPLLESVGARGAEQPKRLTQGGA